MPELHNGTAAVQSPVPTNGAGIAPVPAGVNGHAAVLTPSLLISDVEVARLMSCSRATVSRAEQAGRLPRSLRWGRKRVWRRSDLEMFVSLGMPPVDEFEARRDAMVARNGRGRGERAPGGKPCRVETVSFSEKYAMSIATNTTSGNRLLAVAAEERQAVLRVLDVAFQWAQSEVGR